MEQIKFLLALNSLSIYQILNLVKSYSWFEFVPLFKKIMGFMVRIFKLFKSFLLNNKENKYWKRWRIV